MNKADDGLLKAALIQVEFGRVVLGQVAWIEEKFEADLRVLPLISTGFRHSIALSMPLINGHHCCAVAWMCSSDAASFAKEALGNRGIRSS